MLVCSVTHNISAQS